MGLLLSPLTLGSSERGAADVAAKAPRERCPPLDAFGASSCTTHKLPAQRSHGSIFGATTFIFQIHLLLLLTAYA